MEIIRTASARGRPQVCEALLIAIWSVASGVKADITHIDV